MVWCGMSSTKTIEPTVIKKYANRRLYNTGSSSYVTLEDLAQMVKAGSDFIVTDAKTSDDITHTVLTQIIVEEESKTGQNLLPISFLRQLISFYGDSLQTIIPRYLDTSMNTFLTNQDRLRQYLQGTLGSFFPFGNFEDFNRQQMTMFEQTMKMLTGFAGPSNPDRPANEHVTLYELQKQIQSLQDKIEKLNALEPGKAGTKKAEAQEDKE